MPYPHLDFGPQDRRQARQSVAEFFGAVGGGKDACQELEALQRLPVGPQKIAAGNCQECNSVGRLRC
jgi:hypothetical protein